MSLPNTSELFDIQGDILTDGLFYNGAPPHVALASLKRHILSLIPQLGDDYVTDAAGLAIAKDAVIEEGAYIHPPAIIGHGVTLRHGAYIRGNVIVCGGATVGNSCEVKGSVILHGASLAHYNYVGDSVIGCYAHLGAGATVSNLRLDQKSVKLRYCEEVTDTGLRKLGAMIGDGAQIGCGTVLMPGTVVGKDAIVYPMLAVRGCIPGGAKVRRGTEWVL